MSAQVCSLYRSRFRTWGASMFCFIFRLPPAKAWKERKKSSQFFGTGCSGWLQCISYFCADVVSDSVRLAPCCFACTEYLCTVDKNSWLLAGAGTFPFRMVSNGTILP